MDKRLDWWKMIYKINAVLKSPLMIGGKTLDSNYRESKDYIPGSVLRAAYAKAIIQRCAFEQKNYYLEYKGQVQCENCEFRNICKNFSEITFPFLYPLGGKPYPVTAREKKYKDKEDMEIFDILKCRLITLGKADGETGWERLEGINKDGKKVKLMHSAVTRTAIDYKRNTAKEGSLYTQNVILEQYMNKYDELEDIVFTGEIELLPEEKKELDKINILRIGADITRGFGKCNMSFENSNDITIDTAEKIKQRINEFNLGIKYNKHFVIVDLLTDAYLGLEEIGGNNISQTEIPDIEMMKFLEKKIDLPSGIYTLCKVYKFQEFIRGFDTSKTTEKEMRRNGHLVVKAGAVFIYEAMPEEIEWVKLLEFEQKGIGKNTEHGFGKVRICDMFHIDYDVLRGKNNG